MGESATHPTLISIYYSVRHFRSDVTFVPVSRHFYIRQTVYQINYAEWIKFLGVFGRISLK